MGLVVPLKEGLVYSFVILMPAFGLSLAYGTTRFINFSFGDVFTVGAFAGLFGVSLTSHFVGAMLTAFFFTGAALMVVARILFKPMRNEGPYSLMICSLGLGISIRHIIAIIRGTKPVSLPAFFGGKITLGFFQLRTESFVTILVSAVFVTMMYILINKTRFGARVRSVSSNRLLARMVGIKVEKTISLVWFLAGGAAGLGGVLYGLMTSFNPMLGWQWMIYGFTAVLVGGIGSIKGVVGGALIIGIGSQLASYYWSPGYSMAFVFIVLIVTLLFKPSGIARGRITEKLGQ